MIRLGQAKAADHLAAGQLRQILVALLFVAVGVDRVHHQRRLHGHGRAIAAVHPLDFARDQAIADIVRAGAAIFLGDGRAEQAQFTQLVHDLAMEQLVPVRFQHPRHQLVLAIGVGRIANHPLLIAELIVQQKRIVPLEFRLRRHGNLH